jgi:DNA-binding NtrC family response regulator
MHKTLIFSTDRGLCETLRAALNSGQYASDEVQDKKSLLHHVQASDYPLLILDERAVGQDMDLVSMLREQSQHHILWLAPGDRLVSAIEAIRRGADFFLTLPLNGNHFATLLEQWRKRELPTLYNPAEALQQTVMGENYIGRSEVMRRVFSMAGRVAAVDAPVLITGETGVGKEIVARAIHSLSERANQTFVAVNCGAIPETLLESELFGYRKGAFTGAVQDRMGLFQQADGGTFFLDEIGELSAGLQVKLLRVLEESRIRPLGHKEETPINVRILSATNRDLTEEIRNGKFRMDLFYRLNVVNIHIPPLRERPADIPPLIKHFIEKYNHRFNTNIISITRDALFGLMHYDYPGNIRELENIIQHGILLAEGNIISKTSLPPYVFQRGQLALEGSPREQAVNIQKAEEELIKQALTQFEGNQTEAAKKLGISRSTLWRKIKAYKLENYK